MLGYLFKDKVKFVILVIVEFVSTLMTTGLALVYGNLVNIVAKGATTSELLFAIGLSFGYSLINALLSWFREFYAEYYIDTVGVNMQDDYYANIIHSKYSFISKEDSSKYISNMTNDIDRIRYGYLFQYVALFGKVTAVIASFVAAFILNWKIAVVMAGLTLTMIFIPLFIKKPLDKANVALSNQLKEYTRVLKENFLGVSVVKSYSAEDLSAENVFKSNREVLKKRRKTTILNTTAGGCGNIISSLAIMVLVGLTCYYVLVDEVEIGAVLSIVNIGLGFYGAVLSVASILSYMWGLKSLRMMIWKILGMPKNDRKLRTLHFENALEFKNVAFSYADSDRKVLSDASLIFEKNKKYLVLGKSGSGKSTLLKLIAKFYDEYEGQILLDGVDYREYSEKEITRLIAISMQNCYLFNRTFRENIDFLGDHDAEKMEEIIDFCRLRDFVDLLPNGIETVIDEEVNQVSGGEKLRISLARALYRDSEILLLDEVTSALDKTTSNAIENNLLKLNDKTIINVCHKFNDNTLKRYDQIVIVEDGRIVEIGSYATLKDSEKLALYRNLND